MKDLFVDRIVNVSVLAGVARLDFARVDNINPDDQKIQMSGSYRVAMPVDALVHMVEQGSKVVDELKKQAAQQAPAETKTND